MWDPSIMLVLPVVMKKAYYSFNLFATLIISLEFTGALHMTHYQRR